MNKLITLLGLTISFSMNAQWSYPGSNWAMHAQTSTATGDYAAAMGDNTTASGNYSISMGRSTTASGTYSTAMGYYTTVSDFASVVIGQYNSSGSSATSATLFSTSAPAFVIGNGTDSSNKSDAFKVMFNGDTYVSGSLFLGGTEITSTATELNLLDGVSTIGDGILASVTENSNTGVRLSTSNAANHGDIGSNAVDLSNQISTSSTRGATGLRSTAIGYGTTASGVRSLATGNQTFATGDGSTSMGYDTRAEGYASLAIGQTTTASGTHSTAMGLQTTASGAYSLAIGGLTTASGISSLALGTNTTASGHQSVSAGNSSIASASYSTAFGYGSKASDFTSTVIGQYNNSLSSITTNGSATSYDADNTAFVIGNGTDDSNRSDAFKVMFNGNTTISGDDLTIGDLSAFSGSFTQRSAIDVVAHSDGDLLTAYASGSSGDRFNIELDTGNSLAKISSGGGYNLTLSSEGGTMNFEGGGMGTTTYAFDGDVVVSSDARLKSNIVSLGSTLSKLLLLDGKSYNMNLDGDQKIGVLAQDVQKVFPELVTKGDNEMLAVNYLGLVPVLINALKEQHKEIETYRNEVSELKKQFAEILSTN